ncbi:sulfotransferase [Antarctobacter jejuensis]|uniref:sulfotransferase n=1 Tax=Antarctobacter jejuensis TaxID=1439938 RepID=UPI003FD5B5C4
MEIGLRRYAELDGKTILICVGGTKCATSWLHGYLDSLPGVSASPLKEMHFFNRKFPQNALSDMDLLAVRRLMLYLSKAPDPVAMLNGAPGVQAALDRVQMIYDDDAYFGHFARLCTGETRVLCDVTPAYSVLGAEGFAWMRAVCLEQGMRLRVVFVMRDPVDRFWSQLRHMQQQTIIDDAVKAWPTALQSSAILARGDYRATVSALDESLAEGEVLYLFYESLMQEANLRRLCDFAGAPWQAAETGVRRNETEVRSDLPEDARAAFHAALTPQYAFCHERFGAEVPVGWQG